MRIHIILIFSLITLANCSGNNSEKNTESLSDKSKRNVNWCWFEDSDTGEAKWIKVRGKGKVAQNGRYTLFYSNGAIREKGKREDGMRVDTTFFYSPDEFKIIKYDFRIDDTDTIEAIYPNDGPFKLYCADFKLDEEGIVKNNRRNGIWKWYFKSGKLQQRAGFKNGVEHGIYEVWDKSGMLLAHSFWKDGKQDSLTLLYYKNGNVKEKSYWLDGIPHGPHLYYFKNGQLERKFDTYVNGKKEGIAQEWSEDGKLVRSVHYKEDKKFGTFEYYHANGNIEQKGTAINGVPIGELSFFDEQGKLYEVDTYVNGEIVEIQEY